MTTRDTISQETTNPGLHRSGTHLFAHRIRRTLSSLASPLGGSATGQASYVVQDPAFALGVPQIVNLFCSEDASPAAAAADQGGGAAADEQDQPLRGSGGVEEAPSTPPPKGRGGSLEVPLPQSALDTRPSLRSCQTRTWGPGFGLQRRRRSAPS
ncbi:unnamed protein product [Prorocentrum cordatum]|uniref:Uncharacterized protein n=1 Tax=Prorocentrum cordatum TaxID=2364126 RepID=A0ABN9XL90_9DINO|nr:unnamed protein product [Polarella glacialis]